VKHSSIAWAIFFALAIVSCTQAFGQSPPLHVLEGGDMTIHLMPGPCVDEVSADKAKDALPNERHKELRAIESWWLMSDGSRRPFAGCWAAFTFNGRTGFLVAFADGMLGFIPAEQFGKRKGQVGT
jgi:hypothetical protein